MSYFFVFECWQKHKLAAKKKKTTSVSKLLSHCFMAKNTSKRSEYTKKVNHSERNKQKKNNINNNGETVVENRLDSFFVICIFCAGKSKHQSIILNREFGDLLFDSVYPYWDIFQNELRKAAKTKKQKNREEKKTIFWLSCRHIFDSIQIKWCRYRLSMDGITNIDEINIFWNTIEIIRKRSQHSICTPTTMQCNDSSKKANHHKLNCVLYAWSHRSIVPNASLRCACAYAHISVDANNKNDNIQATNAILSFAVRFS